jgi:enamine deaminase RidA (YjgF/YER057c/UK114 family)
MTGLLRIETSRRLSRAVVAGGTVYLSGVTARSRTPDVADQMRQIVALLDEQLVAAGSHKSRILFTQIFMKDIQADFRGMNAVWEDWLPCGCAPARSTVQAVLALPELLLEVVITADLGEAIGVEAVDPRYGAIHVFDGF